MQLLTNTTSPYARLVRIAAAEKGLDLDAITHWVQPWDDAAMLRAANVSARVPTLITDDGVALTDSKLILQWLDKTYPEPSLTDGPLDTIFHQAGIALDVIDAMIDLLTNVLHYDAAYAEHPVGLKRRRTIVEGIARLEDDVPAYVEDTPPTIAVMGAITALDYARFALADMGWADLATPRLDALRKRLEQRASVTNTRPYAAG